MLKSYKAVFFDVGGTLLKVHPSVGEVYTRHARPYGFSQPAEAVDREFRKQWRQMGGIASLGRQSGVAAEKKFWRELVLRVFDRFGGLDDFENYFEHIYEVFKGKDSWRIFDDVVESEIFLKLKQRGVVLGVISNWDSRLSHTLTAIGLAKHFDFVLVSAEVGAAKPDRKIFDEALRLSGVRPEQACHVGDEPETDILGARNVGIDAILVDRKGRYGNDVKPKVRSFLELV